MPDAMRDWIVVYLKGVLMGAADTVPGVSGGTMALITGIYDRLVSAIASLHPRPLRHLPALGTDDGRRQLVEEFGAMDVPFLAVLGAGIGTAVVVLSRFMHTAMLQYPAPTNALFFGLIGASAVVLYREVAVDSWQSALTGVAGFTAAFLVTGVSEGGGLGHGVPVIFLTGVVASAAMLLPGISGAAFLYILGQYTFMTGLLERFVDGLLAFPAAPGLVSDGLRIAVFLAGVGVGVITIAHGVARALERYRQATMVGLVSLMVGALRMPVEAVMAATGTWTVPTVVAVVVPAVVGAAAVLLLDRHTEELDY